MIKIILTFILAIFSITPVKGDGVEILTPPWEHTGTLHGMHAQVHSLRKLAGHTWKFSFPRFPNISSFEIKLGYFNPLLLAFGLAGRLPAEIKTELNNNARLNRYLLRCQIRLFRHFNDPQMYWLIAGHLIQRSNCYMIGCLHLIDKNSYRILTYKRFKQLIRDIDLIRGRTQGQMSPHLLYRRVYIPKGETSFRPLGVPSMAWRVYLNMLLHPLVIKINLGDSQHGFRPGMGTLTAWKSVLGNVIPSPSIYEFDLKQCFPSVSLPRLEWLLRDTHDLPKHWANYYTGLNFVPPVFKDPTDLKLDESQSLELIRTTERNEAAIYNEPVPVYQGVPSLRYFAGHNNAAAALKFNAKFHTPDRALGGKPWGRAFFKKTTGPESILAIKSLIESNPSLSEKTIIPNDILDAFVDSLDGIDKGVRDTVAINIERSAIESEDSIPDEVSNSLFLEWLKLVGTAQGSPLSPFLAAVSLDELRRHLPEGVEILLYADDGMFYGPGVPKFISSGEMVKFMKRYGFTVHPDKSGWVKHEDLWVKPLKFLGLVYDGEYDLLKASTRKGATLVYNQHGLLEAEYDVQHAMNLGSRGLAEKMRSSLRMSMAYRQMHEIRKSLLASQLYDYYQRLYILMEAMASIRLPHTEEETYDASWDAFLWYYYIFITRLFYMSRDHLIRTIASGVLALRNREAIRRYLFDSFSPTGAENTPLAYQVLPLPRGETKSGWLRKFQWTLKNFKFTQESESTDVAINDPASAFPLFHLRDVFVIESNNSYLKTYRNKYSWSNFIRSSYAGFIISRLYNNTYSFDDFTQNFKYTFTGCSIGETLKSQFPTSMNIFIATSFAVIRELNLCLAVQSNRRSKAHTPYLSVRECVMKSNQPIAPRKH